MAINFSSQPPFWLNLNGKIVVTLPLEEDARKFTCFAEILVSPELEPWFIDRKSGEIYSLADYLNYLQENSFIKDACDCYICLIALVI